jgi:hypothetical protein
VRDLELLGQGHRASGGLLAVPERGVEDADATYVVVLGGG